jgi:hypothetical protein
MLDDVPRRVARINHDSRIGGEGLPIDSIVAVMIATTSKTTPVSASTCPHRGRAWVIHTAGSRAFHLLQRTGITWADSARS